MICDNYIGIAFFKYIGIEIVACDIAVYTVVYMAVYIYIRVSDFSRMSDDELYDNLLEQYISWLRAMNIN